MPLHISEIGVRLAVGSGAGPGTRSSGSGAGPGGGSGPGPGGSAKPTAIPPEKVDEIVSQSVQRVLEQLRALEAR